MLNIQYIDFNLFIAYICIDHSGADGSQIAITNRLDFRPVGNTGVL
uniref:Uncharacterized protein n=1 Tax=Anguilla anguilla TaxID=7936 RepID=A0A0E9XRS7_ANGAN